MHILHSMPYLDSGQERGDWGYVSLPRPYGHVHCPPFVLLNYHAHILLSTKHFIALLVTCKAYTIHPALPSYYIPYTTHTIYLTPCIIPIHTPRTLPV
ncbi:hypothetical protein EON63_22480 [archaeon]|nr:MAG: hypothetical protein EON63_22480 [archaeon]